MLQLSKSNYWYSNLCPWVWQNLNSQYICLSLLLHNSTTITFLYLRCKINSAGWLGLYSRCLDLWLNGKFKETGWLKNEHAILLQVQRIHTASVFWHTHQAQRHPTHQLSSHVKFTQSADRQANADVCCTCASACMMHAHPRECETGSVHLQPSVLYAKVFVWVRLLDWECQERIWRIWEYHTLSSTGKINRGNNKCILCGCKRCDRIS